jgi:hypothetical protein
MRTAPGRSPIRPSTCAAVSDGDKKKASRVEEIALCLAPRRRRGAGEASQGGRAGVKRRREAPY